MLRLFLTFIGGVALVTIASADPVDFAREVRPILSQNCYACHGPDSEHREADLRLDTEEGMKAEYGGEQAVVPGDPAHSEMVRRIKSTSTKKHMPPADSGKKLTAQQIAILENWIGQGAKWSEYWSFVPPVKAELPAVKDAAWAVTPIDRFILARLEKEDLRPSPPTDRPGGSTVTFSTPSSSPPARPNRPGSPRRTTAGAS